MLQLDPTTQASLEAATTPNARAAAILSSLTGTITVTVRDGTGSTKGSGTMTSFGVQSANVIVLNNVTSFTVSETGTPDPATWTIEFATASGRFVKGTFGLYTSPVAEFKWSLATWENGQSGTIANAYCTVAKREVLVDALDTFDVAQSLVNSAPYWLPSAPSSLTLSIGGTQDFNQYALDPDGDALTYSLAATYTGYSITAQGVLSVGTGATSRTVSVRVTDPSGLSSDWPVTVTVASVGDWPAATRIVRTSGGTVDGLPTYTTVNAALAAAVAGDIIEIVAATGTSQTIAQNVLISGKNGTALSPITLRVRQGHTIMFRPTSGTVLTVTGSSYVTITGANDLYGSLKFGNEADWLPYTTSASGFTNYPHGHTCEVINSNRIWIKDCTFSGGKEYRAVVVLSTSHHVAFDHCRFARHGTQWNPATSNETMDGFSTFGARTVVRNSVFDRFGGHDQCVFYRNHQVAHSNTFDGYWADINPITGQATKEGYRCASFQANSHTKWTGDGEGIASDPEALLFGPLHIMENEFHRCSANGSSTEAYKLLGWQVTSRGNLILDGVSSVTSLWAYQIDGFVQMTGDGPGSNPREGQHRFIHDTIYNFNATVVGNTSTAYSPTGNSVLECSGDRHANNLCQQIGNLNTGVTYWFMRDLVNVPLTGFANAWKGQIFEGNVVGFTATAGRNVRSVQLGTQTYLTNVESAWPDNFYDNALADTTFTSVGAFRSRTKAGFLPTGGTGYNDAPALATVTSGGGTSTSSIVLSDAVWLYDPENSSSYDLGYFGEQNDYIAYGTSLATAQLVQIASVNRTTGAVTLKSAINAPNGTSIWFGGNPGIGGVKVWKHRGAVQ